MRRIQALRLLRMHATEIRARGVKSLALFGSVARDQARANSDVDVLVEIDRRRAPRFSLLDQVALQNFLCDALGAPVQVTARGRMHPLVKQSIQADAVRVF